MEFMILLRGSVLCCSVNSFWNVLNVCVVFWMGYNTSFNSGFATLLFFREVHWKILEAPMRGGITLLKNTVLSWRFSTWWWRYVWSFTFGNVLRVVSWLLTSLLFSLLISVFNSLIFSLISLYCVLLFGTAYSCEESLPLWYRLQNTHTFACSRFLKQMEPRISVFVDTDWRRCFY